MTAAVATAAPSMVGGRFRAVWIYGPLLDSAVAWCWLPVFVVWHLLASGPSATAGTLLRDGVLIALAVSFLHQPLTLGLVYGDRRQFALHRRLFVAAPLVAVAVAVVAAAFHLWIVIPVAAAWNLQHTLQQRYGLQRIYAGKSRYGSARLDRALSYVPMAMVLAAVAAMPGTEGLVRRSGLDSMNAGAIRLLTDARPAAVALLLVTGVATFAVLAAIVRQEAAAGEQANPAKWAYQGASLALLAAIVVDPAAGFIAYVTQHAVEYGVIVYRTARQRYGAAGAHPPEEDGKRALLQRLAARAPGRIAYLGGIVAAALAVRLYVQGAAFSAVLYSVGMLHFSYDAVIWKLRKPAVAKDFAIARPAPG